MIRRRPSHSRKFSRKQMPHQEDEVPYIPPRTEEQLLIEHLSTYHTSSALCSSHGRGQLAGFLASENPSSRICCHYLDSHFAELSQVYWGDADHAPEIICSPDFPEESFETVCLPVHKQGDAELTRDFLQQGFMRLKTKGMLYAAVDQPKDQWLHQQLQALFPKVTRRERKRGVIYSAQKTAELKRVRNFTAEFTANYRGRMLNFQSRPGVFSHRRLDAGAWALMQFMNIQSGMHVLDLGCGSGVVGIAAMLATDNVTVLAIDSHARAVECAQMNANRNLDEAQQGRYQVQQTHSGRFTTEQKFDTVLANPPYFSHFKIARLFVESAVNVMKPDAELLIVTKMSKWYEEHLPEIFQQVASHQQGEYQIVVASQPQ